MKNKILICVDCQNDFIDGQLGTKEAQAVVPAIVEKIKNFDGQTIIATMDTHDNDYLNTTEGKKLPVPHCIKGTDGWKINQKVLDALKARGYETITKRCFTATDLFLVLMKYGYDTSYELFEAETRYDTPDELFEIEIIGLCTDICVISNALYLKAMYPDAEITVDSKCCAGVTPEKHEAALEVMRSCQINVI